MPLILNGTTGISGVDGSAGTPSYQGTDTNTGIFYPAADTIAFAEGGVEVARFNSSGNLGIGTTNPTYKLQVNGGTGTNAGPLSLDGTTTSSIFFVTNATNGAFNGLTITGDPLILGVQNQSLLVGVHDGSAIRFGDTDMRFGTDSNERMRLDSSGNLGIGNTPSAWGGTHKAIQLGSGGNQGAIVGQTNANAISLVSNGSFNGTNWIYGNSVPSGLYTISQNQHIWYRAPTGTTGNAISYTENMRIDAAGIVLISTTSTGNVNGLAPKLAVNGGVSVVGGVTQTALLEQGILTNDSGGNNNYWQFLGRFSANQGGAICAIRYYYHVGFNSNNVQNGIIDIFFKTANGTSSQSGSTGPFYGDGQYFKLGPQSVNAVRVVQQPNIVDFDIYVQMGNFSNQSFYTVATSGGTYWTDSGTGSTSAPTGNFITLTANNITYT